MFHDFRFTLWTVNLVTSGRQRTKGCHQRGAVFGFLMLPQEHHSHVNDIKKMTTSQNTVRRQYKATILPLFVPSHRQAETCCFLALANLLFTMTLIQLIKSQGKHITRRR